CRPLVAVLVTNVEWVLTWVTLVPEVTTSEASIDSVLLSLPPPSKPVPAVTVALVVRNRFVLAEASSAFVLELSSRLLVTALVTRSEERRVGQEFGSGGTTNEESIG